MARIGGQPGNKNATKAKPWEAAIRAAINLDRQALIRVAKTLIKQAEDGDIAAAKEIGDRLDGKAKQSSEISGPDGGPFQAAISVAFVDADRSKS